MMTNFQGLLCPSGEGREIRAEDFHPWSYNLHYITASEPWYYHYHRHFGCFEFVYTLSGTVEHLLEGEWKSFSSGDLLAVGEEDHHALRGSNFSYANLIVPVTLWNKTVDASGIDDPLSSPKTCNGLTLSLPSDTRNEFKIHLNRLFRHQQTPEGERQFRRFIARLLFDVYWDESSLSGDRTELPTGKNSSAPSWWTDLVRQVEESDDIPADPSSLADLAGRSREHVSRTCRRFLNCSPSNWLNRLRLERSALLLCKTNRDISDIVYSLGFGNLHHFYRLFRDMFGMPPGEYRKKHGDAT